ncbi:MAG: hypothetical protein ACOCQN_01510 [Halanaerobiaceae bacterium]
MTIINARGLYYRDLNSRVRDLIQKGEKEITIKNVNGQRYIGDGIDEPIKLFIDGTPGNDMAAFAGGVEITVNGNVQDATANTMNGGKLIIHGNTGDISGYAMRGGEVYIKGSVGYRVGIHMKGYKDKQPLIIIGGTAGDFFGEYMAGGRLILLGVNREKGQEIIGNHIGVGMHGGIIYIRGKVEEYKVGPEVRIEKADKDDKKELISLLWEYCDIFDFSIDEIINSYFSKLVPVSSRPYGKLYAY